MKVYIPHKAMEKHVGGRMSIFKGTALYVTTLFMYLFLVWDNNCSRNS